MHSLLATLVLLFPLLGFLILGLGFRRVPKNVAALIGPGSVLASFILTLILFLVPSPGQNGTVYRLFTWIETTGLQIPFELLIDPLSLLMMLVITGVGFLIHVYSVGYMKDDEGFNRFFSFMNLFVFSMLLLVTGANFPVMFIGWEGVGLCSYLLIGFWFKNDVYNLAARKAFVMNRIGDLGFLLAMFLIFKTFNSLSFQSVFLQASTMEPGNMTLLAITLLLFIGATGKSAQIPLYTWLPDAMAGPTPVSALIHAATMVTAGIYMIVRANVLFLLAPVTLQVIGIIGLATALLAAAIALFQNDIKKVLAYSTISQLGYMFLGISAGAFTGAMFHLTTHAFFKALLFLAAGSVIHALGGEQDIRNMGGLKRAIPKTYWVFLAGTLTIAGLPPLSGFFSKDQILAHVFARSPLMWVLALAGSMMTAFYMFRLFFLVFGNSYRGNHDRKNKIHESPPVMVIPLILLAILSVLGGWLNCPESMGGSHLLDTFLSPVLSIAGTQAQAEAPATETEWILVGITLALILITIGWAYQRFMVRKHTPPREGIVRPTLIRLFENKFYVDELYERLFIQPLQWCSGFFHTVLENRLIDGVVNGTGRLFLRGGGMIRILQTGHVGFYLFVMVLGVIATLVYTVMLNP